uniref:Uncharacterized protein n=1 Tax=Anguilla anguilla TaxID=7936 RepID=A0A0E9UV64_ANGAN
MGRISLAPMSLTIPVLNRQAMTVGSGNGPWTAASIMKWIGRRNT